MTHVNVFAFVTAMLRVTFPALTFGFFVSRGFGVALASRSAVRATTSKRRFKDLIGGQRVFIAKAGGQQLANERDDAHDAACRSGFHVPTQRAACARQ